MLTFIRAGVLSLVVDKGRQGFQNIGVTQGGPMDQSSCLWANWLVGNQTILASVEILASDVVFTTSQPCTIALTGGVSVLKINQHTMNVRQSHRLRAGDKVCIAENRFGLRSYLAIAGGFNVQQVFGSCTTVTRDGLGGLDGKGTKLADGDQLPFSNHSLASVNRTIPKEVSEKTSTHLSLRVIKGYQIDDFSAVQLQQLFSRTFTVSAQSSRMAVRLEGDAIIAPSRSLYSEGITRGAVQIPPQGLPIIMLNDRQTVGGYPKIGSILSLDCDALAQSAAGVTVSFEPIDIQDAHNILSLHHARLKRWFEEGKEHNG
ncbi:biotin-dependent carboxyltransferase family protein [Aliiglaciecola litoralis]|uniref:Biotin-dependent carboxyltransferase family protein n=1 Tax=Aliiglaciecola litoralis TaxID=582857 RepID=A0ABN1LCJ3_9ALTE